MKAICVCQNLVTFIPQNMFSLIKSGFLSLIFLLNQLLVLPYLQLLVFSLTPNLPSNWIIIHYIQVYQYRKYVSHSVSTSFDSKTLPTESESLPGPSNTQNLVFIILEFILHCFWLIMNLVVLDRLWNS